MLWTEVLCHVPEQALEAGHRQPARARQRLQRRLRSAPSEPARIRMVRVDVESRAGAAHAAHEGDRGERGPRRARRGGAAGDHVAGVEGVQGRDGGMRQSPDEGARRGRVQAADLVRLVPDLPLVHPRVALRRGCHELGERLRALRRSAPPQAAARPGRCAPDGQDDVDPVRVQPGEQGIGRAPVVRWIVRVRGRLGPPRRDVVPADRVADDADAEAVEHCQAPVERRHPRRPDLEPGIVLEAVFDLPRSRSCRAEHCAQGDGGGLEGVDALIVMWQGVSEQKVEATRAYGGTVDLEACDPLTAFERLGELVAETGRTLVHGFDDPDVIAGHGTIALELEEDAADASVIVVPAGGGGLVSGIAAAAETRVVAVEPEGSRALQEGLRAGRPVTVRPSSIADGLSAPFAGENCIAVCQARGVESVLVSEAEIETGFRFLYGRAKLACEPAGAVGVAALLAGKVPLNGAKGVVVVVSGGNVAAETAAAILARR